jgi:hypothetical protein
MPGYNQHRPTRPIARLNAVTKNEASSLADIVRDQRYIQEREKLADERRLLEQPTRRNFADLVKK